MKSLIKAAVAGVLLGLALVSCSPAFAQVPPLPGTVHSCVWLSNDAVSCRDGFGNNVNCVLRETYNIIRWSCHG